MANTTRIAGALISLLLLTTAGCSGGGSDGPAAGPKWLVGGWSTIHDEYLGGDPLVLHRDGRAEVEGLDGARWSSDGSSVTINGTRFDILVSKGCQYLTFSDDLSDMYSSPYFTKNDPPAGCPTSPTPLTKIESKLVGNYDVDRPYDADTYLQGGFELRADRKAVMLITAVSETSSYIPDTTNFTSEGVWRYNAAKNVLSVTVPSFDEYGEQGIDWDLYLDNTGTPTQICMDDYDCSDVIPD